MKVRAHASLDMPVVHTVRGIDKTTVFTYQDILLMEDTLA